MDVSHRRLLAQITQQAKLPSNFVLLEGSFVFARRQWSVQISSAAFIMVSTHKKKFIFSSY